MPVTPGTSYEYVVQFLSGVTPVTMTALTFVAKRVGTRVPEEQTIDMPNAAITEVDGGDYDAGLGYVAGIAYRCVFVLTEGAWRLTASGSTSAGVRKSDGEDVTVRY